MTSAERFHASAVIALPKGIDLTDTILSQLEDGDVSKTEQGWRVTHELGQIALKEREAGIEIALDAGDRTSLAYLQLGITHRFSELGDGLALDWRSDNRPGMLLPYFREMRVVEATSITPHMRRVRLAGDDLDRFSRTGLHIRLLFPPKGVTKPAWPQIGKNGEAVWPDGDDRPLARVYTIRSIDVDRGLVDVDMVLHEGDAYPGAGWAARARAGDIVGMVGPGGSDAPVARKLVLLGDETALPAIGRILEGAASGTQAIVRVEIADEAEKQVLTSRADLDLEWLSRNGRDAGTTGLLPDALKALSLRGDDLDLFVWAGCEFSAFKAIRGHLRKEIGLPTKQHLVVSYWRRGVAEAD